MKLRGGSFGMIVTLVVMAVVLVLVAKAWQKYGPAAQQVREAERPTTTAGADADGLPDLDATRNATDAHADAVDEALAATE